MKFRITMKQLDEWEDRRLLKALVTERRSELNIYAPLATRLAQVEERLSDGRDRLIQFQCQKEGTLFYYQTGVMNAFFVCHCPVCGSRRVQPTGREYVGVNEDYRLPETKASR